MSAITRQVAASKVQLVQNDGAHRLVGILKNEGASAISGAQVTVMLYDAGGKLIGSGNGYGGGARRRRHHLRRALRAVRRRRGRIL